MIYKKRPSEIQGLWCRSDKTFYFLETGHHSVRNPLDRIRNTLTTRGLVPLQTERLLLNEEPLLKMSLAVAQEKDYEVDWIYLNPHVQAQVEAERAGGDGLGRKNPWATSE
jgi:hypothetical protein